LTAPAVSLVTCTDGTGAKTLEFVHGTSGEVAHKALKNRDTLFFQVSVGTLQPIQGKMGIASARQGVALDRGVLSSWAFVFQAAR
jgi:hypothetical protein